MLFSIFADVTVVAHLAFVTFVPIGGFIALRHPRLLVAHAPCVAWALGIATIGWPCPLTGLENALRERAGESAYGRGFIDHYLTGVVYPERYLPLVQALVAVSVITSYVMLVRRRRALHLSRHDLGLSSRDAGPRPPTSAAWPRTTPLTPLHPGRRATRGSAGSPRSGTPSLGGRRG